MGRLLLYDALEANFETLNLKRNPNCPLCGKAAIHHVSTRNKFCMLD